MVACIITSSITQEHSEALMIKVTEVKVYPVRSQEKETRLKAYATIVFEGVFIVRDLKVIMGNDGGLFVSMPSRRSKYGSFRDIAHPLNADMRTEIEKAVISEYERALVSSNNETYDAE